MSRSFVIALVALGVLLAIGGAAGYWVMHNDRNPPPPEADDGVGFSPRRHRSSPRVTWALAIPSISPLSEPGAGSSHAVPLALRELIRQAFLMAARDEVGLSTRDVMLREEFPAKPDANSSPFRLSCCGNGHGRTRFHRLRARPWTGRIVALGGKRSTPRIPIPNGSRPSRRRQRPYRAANSKACSPAPAEKELCVRLAPRPTSPGATSDLLWTWNEISVLAGLRRVHAEIRDKGESPQLLAALGRRIRQSRVAHRVSLQRLAQGLPGPRPALRRTTAAQD